LKSRILNLNRRIKKLIIIFVDYISIICSFYFSSYILFKDVEIHNIGYWIVIYIPPVIAIIFYYYSNLYQNILRFMHTGTFFTLFLGASFYSIFLGLIPLLFLNDSSFAMSLIVVNFLTLIFLLTITRLFARWFLVSRDKNSHQKNIIIYGAGDAGVQIANALLIGGNYKPIAFIDDDNELHNTRISDIRVYSFDGIINVINKYDAKEILIAIPSLSDQSRKELFARLENITINIRTLPDIDEIVSGNVTVEDIRSIEIEDLLQREVIKPKTELLEKNINNKAVLITGAGGSIGSEIARQVLKYKPSIIILYEANEYSLYSIEKEIKNNIEELQASNTDLISILGILDNFDILKELLSKYAVNTVYHAAAYKHVPLVEANQVQGVRNNIFGSLNIIIAAIQSNIENFVLISTDKAVRPTSLMGATKRFTEIIIQSLSNAKDNSLSEINLFGNKVKPKNTSFSIVRFGNVLNSSGSVVPLFKEQIKNKGPITVTDPNITRFFMSTREAVELVIQAGAMAKGGDIFILDMGEPITILDLAKKMIKLSGYDVAGESESNKTIEIIYTGLRPGEKLYEELFIDPVKEITLHPKIFKTKQEFLSIEDLNHYLELLQNASIINDSMNIYNILTKAIPEYVPKN
jgi:FlaA1/EpsC-like NDP-sugar epimerase